jgi:hypothetical protein
MIWEPEVREENGFYRLFSVSGGQFGGTEMKRRVTVQGRHIEVQIDETSPGVWTASAEHQGEILKTTASAANRAASDWRDRANEIEGRRHLGQA